MAFLLTLAFFIGIFWFFHALDRKYGKIYRFKQPVRVLEAKKMPIYTTGKLVLDMGTRKIKGFPEYAPLQTQLDWFGEPEAVTGEYRLYPSYGISCRINPESERLRAVHCWLGGNPAEAYFPVASKSAVPCRLMLAGPGGASFNACATSTREEILAAFGQTSNKGACARVTDHQLCYWAPSRSRRTTMVHFQFSPSHHLEAVTVEWTFGK